MGLSRVFSSTTVQSINSLALSLFYGPVLTSVIINAVYNAACNAGDLSLIPGSGRDWVGENEALKVLEGDQTSQS